MACGLIWDLDSRSTGPRGPSQPVRWVISVDANRIRVLCKIVDNVGAGYWLGMIQRYDLHG